MSEEIYDREIAPELRRLADRCKELGMPFVAAVEYSPGDRGVTASGIADSNMDMRVVYIASRCGSNLDRLMLTLSRIITGARLPHNSIALQRFGVEPRVEERPA